MKKVFFAAIAAMVMVSVSNVFASSKMMMDETSAVPVDTVAPTTPVDSSVVDAPVTPQAGAEDDTTKQETTTENNANAETPVETVDDSQKQTPVQEENATQEESAENQQTTEQNVVSE